ncbi:MAG: glycosyltransferase [Flavobacteriaceae bacterium]|nr:glycosyltransferase [Flavobacteriaceae bacterium]
MRIAQIIDSLEAGGAERMAVNYANALTEKIDFSGLVCTRKEGALQLQLDKKVVYSFVHKKSALDLVAIWKLRRYVKRNKVGLLHVHSTSFFMALVLKLICPSIKLIWHDHYGQSEFLASRNKILFRIGLPFYHGVISVNKKLKKWTTQSFHFKNVIYLPNFSSQVIKATHQPDTILKGKQGKRIVLLANLRPQKNHFLLIQIAKRVKLSHSDWTFHLVGKDFKDAYAAQIKKAVIENKLDDTVFIYGSKEDVSHILSQSTIGILTSSSEGLPLALLEYGNATIPVVVTNVGEIAEVVTNNTNGYVVSGNEHLFYEKLVNLMEDQEKRATFAKALSLTMVEKFGMTSIIKQYLKWLDNNIK